MSRLLSVRNCQRVRAVNTLLFRRLARWLLVESLRQVEFTLNIRLVDAPAMARLNERFLQHSGSTDVITFDYAEEGSSRLDAEIVICVADAVSQARQFQTKKGLLCRPSISSGLLAMTILVCLIQITNLIL